MGVIFLRLGMNRRIKIRIFPAHSTVFFENTSKLLVLLLVLAMFSAGITYYYTKICPLIVNLAKVHCTERITTIVNRVINEEIKNNAFGYEDFATIQKGSDGQIQAMFMNTKQMNTVKSSLAIKLHEKIVSADNTELKIPLGSIIEGYIFSGAGPKINISLVPIGYALIDFESTFSDAGINQTKHQIDIVVDASFGMIMASGNERINIKTTVPLAQTIIVGDVPDSVF